ncbi:MAG: hypothetical protein EXS13_13465 [Planctomycetes bacterium]|nr:hypothetical protein [Planctomycetota bacterium]
MSRKLASRAIAALRAAACALALLDAAGAAPSIQQDPGDAAFVESALDGLRRGDVVDANLATLRDAIERSKDPGALAKQIGGRLLLEGRYTLAADFLAVARARLPADGNVASQLGKAHALLQHFDEAVAHLSAADQLLPAGPHPIVKQFLATALAGQQRFDDAVAMAERAIADAQTFNAALPPGRPPLSLVEYELALADVHYIAVRFERALRVLDRVAALSPAPDEAAKAALLRAKILDSRADEAGALAAFAAARAAAPKSAEACYESAAFLLRRQRHAEAKPFLEQTVALDPQHEGAWFSLARVLTRVGDAAGGKAASQRYRVLHDAKSADDLRFTELSRALAEKK